MTDFHFLRPWWLMALPLLAAWLWALYRHQAKGGDWRELCDPALLPYMVIGTPARASRHPLWLAGLAGVLAILALAGPVWERLPVPVFRNLSALVVVLDLSSAMNAADLKPNRLTQARFKIEDLLRARKDGQTALIAYAGDAFVVTPITDDGTTIAAQLAALNPGLMPVPGSRPDLGLASAARLLKQAGLKTGDILLMTGEASAAADKLAAQLHSEGYRVSVLGTGSEDGAPVPLPQGGFLKDEQGNILVPKLDSAGLTRLAQSGGGIYRPLGVGDLDVLLRLFDQRPTPAEQSGDNIHLDQWREPGVWLLPPLLILGALGFRRGWLGVWLVVLLAPMPEPALAFEWQDLWLTPDQRAQRELAAGHPDAAAQRFQNPAWKAAADYKAGHYEQAAKALANATTASGQYNLGNALAQQGNYQEAIKAYDQALKLDPGNDDAKYNKQQVEAALRKQQEQQKPQDQQDKQDGQDQGQDQQPSGQDGKPKDGQNQQAQDQAQDQQPSSGQDSQPENGQKQDAEQATDKPADKNKRGQPNQTVQPDEPQPGPEDKSAKPTPAETQTPGETQQAEEQWLRRIPDDPGGLLKRKFAYQYRQRQQQQQQQERTPW